LVGISFLLTTGYRRDKPGDRFDVTWCQDEVGKRNAVAKSNFNCLSSCLDCEMMKHVIRSVNKQVVVFQAHREYGMIH
jgi:hypothetical protein